MHRRVLLTAAVTAPLATLGLAGCSSTVDEKTLESYAAWLRQLPSVVGVVSGIEKTEDGLGTRELPDMGIVLADGTTHEVLSGLAQRIREHDSGFTSFQMVAATVDGVVCELGTDEVSDNLAVESVEAIRKGLAQVEPARRAETVVRTYRGHMSIQAGPQGFTTAQRLLAADGPLVQGVVAARRTAHAKEPGRVVLELSRELPPSEAIGRAALQAIQNRGNLSLGEGSEAELTRLSVAAAADLVGHGFADASPAAAGAVLATPLDAVKWRAALERVASVAGGLALNAKLGKTLVVVGPVAPRLKELTSIPDALAALPEGIECSEVISTNERRQARLLSSGGLGGANAPADQVTAMEQVLAGTGTWPLSRFVATYTVMLDGYGFTFRSSGLTTENELHHAVTRARAVAPEGVRVQDGSGLRILWSTRHREEQLRPVFEAVRGDWPEGPVEFELQKVPVGDAKVDGEFRSSGRGRATGLKLTNGKLAVDEELAQRMRDAVRIWDETAQ